ncbi:hypothetical protein BO71DRAFT_457533, partial [Aspergillus ellipticus CBS 707.79]
LDTENIKSTLLCFGAFSRLCVPLPVATATLGDRPPLKSNLNTAQCTLIMIVRLAVRALPVQGLHARLAITGRTPALLRQTTFIERDDLAELLLPRPFANRAHLLGILPQRSPNNVRRARGMKECLAMLALCIENVLVRASFLFTRRAFVLFGLLGLAQIPDRAGLFGSARIACEDLWNWNWFRTGGKLEERCSFGTHFGKYLTYYVGCFGSVITERAWTEIG